MKTITIRLAGLMQSYGDEANFDYRTTSRYPSKSAVIGMIAAALGYQRNDPRIVDLNQLAFAVRVDQPGNILRDFQIVEWKPGERKLTYRDCLQDAVFVVAIGSEDEALIAQIKTALTHPKYQLFLGRRANVPTVNMQIQEISDDPVQALKKREWAASAWYQNRKRHEKEVNLNIFADANLITDNPNRTKMVKDQVVSFDPRDRQHTYRALRHKRLSFENPSFRSSDATEHDAMSALGGE